MQEEALAVRSSRLPQGGKASPRDRETKANAVLGGSLALYLTRL
jgi:hypothetical protein